MSGINGDWKETDRMKAGMAVRSLIVGLVVAVLATPAGSATTNKPAGTLTVEISGFRNIDGMARVCLYDSKNGFPLRQELAARVITTDIFGNKARAIFREVPPGIYAVSVLHDENGNGRMDTNALGMPKEGAGASNNPQPMLGPPGYEDARFTVTGSDMIIRVTIYYLTRE